MATPAASPASSWPPLVAAACATTLGGAAIVGTRLLAGSLDPLTLALLRYGGATACLVLLAALLVRPARRLPARDALAIGALGLLYFGLFPWLFTAALRYTTAAHGALVVSLTPMLTLLFAGALGRERVDGRKLLGVGAAMAGVAAGVAEQLAAAPARGGASLGDFLMLLGACISAGYGVLSRPLVARHSALLVMTGGMVAGSLGLLVAALAAGVPLIPPLKSWQWGVVAFLAVPGCAAAFYLLVWAYGRAPPTRVAIFLTLNPVVAMLAGAALLEEPLTALQLIGLALVAVGIGVVSWPARGVRSQKALP